MQTNPMNVEHITFPKTGQTCLKTMINCAYIEYYSCVINAVVFDKTQTFIFSYTYLIVHCKLVFLAMLLADHKQWILISNTLHNARLTGLFHFAAWYPKVAPQLLSSLNCCYCTNHKPTKDKKTLR